MKATLLASWIALLVVAPVSAQRSALLDELLRQRGIELVDDRDIAENVGERTITGGKLSATLAREFDSLLVGELSTLPADFIQASELRRIVIVGKSGNPGDRGVYVHNTDTLYLVAPTGKADESHRCAVHHELFHLVDRIDDGSVEHDADWEKLNAPGFRYAYTGQERAGFDERVVGFVSEYARSSVGEDKAETFAALMIRHAAMQERCVRDKVLAAKVERMKVTLRRFSAHMDDPFWEQSRATSMSLTQRWAPGRYKITAYFEVEDLGVSGVIRQWGTFTYDAVVDAPGVDDEQLITLEPIAIASSLRAAGMTLAYDSADATAEQDPSLRRVFEPMLRMPLRVTIGRDLRVRRLKGYDEYVERVREEQDEPAVIRARGGKVDVENGKLKIVAAEETVLANVKFPDDDTVELTDDAGDGVRMVRQKS